MSETGHNEIERTSSNSARTTALYERKPGEALDAAERAISGLSNWSLAGRDDEGLRAVRTTSLLRFKDDVHVVAEPANEPGRTRLELTSASRLGKGDLGQNPRNLRELLDALNQELGDPR
jgi:uncharacterized protein (DUF1499 family)